MHLMFTSSGCAPRTIFCVLSGTRNARSATWVTSALSLGQGAFT